MDHYTELVLAGVERWGRSWLDELDVAIINDSVLQPIGAPDQGIKWRAYKVRGEEISWLPDLKCPACIGLGQLRVAGYDGVTYHCDCPKCYGAGALDEIGGIVTDERGDFLRLDV